MDESTINFFKGTNRKERTKSRKNIMEKIFQNCYSWMSNELKEVLATSSLDKCDRKLIDEYNNKINEESR